MRTERPAAQTERPGIGEPFADRGREMIGDGDLLATRHGNWKVVFLEQRSKGLAVWREDFSHMRVPKLFNLRSDPFEAGEDTVFYDKWTVDHVFIQVPIQAIVAKWIGSFQEFPIRQKAASFSLDRVMEKLMPRAA